MNINGKLELHPLQTGREDVADDVGVLQRVRVRARRDVTIEVHATDQVLGIEELLQYCRSGRRIIVTSRGVPVAKIMALRTRGDTAGGASRARARARTAARS